jgi:hypothetical protein
LFIYGIICTCWYMESYINFMTPFKAEYITQFC